MKSDITAIVEELWWLCAVNRSVGNTHLVINGLANVEEKCIVVVAYENQKQQYKKYKKHIILTIDDIMNSKLKGLKCPLILDNSAIFYILENILPKLTNQDLLEDVVTPIKQILDNLNRNRNVE